jgi:hypothetical protein
MRSEQANENQNAFQTHLNQAGEHDPIYFVPNFICRSANTNFFYSVYPYR